MQTVLDCPIIRNMERTGTPDGKPEPEYRCPICKGFRNMNKLKVNEILENQMELLITASEQKTCSPSDLCALTDKIVELCRINAHEIKFVSLE